MSCVNDPLFAAGNSPGAHRPASAIVDPVTNWCISHCLKQFLFAPLVVAAPKLKRTPKGPREGFTLENVKPESITAIPYDIIKEGLLG